MRHVFKTKYSLLLAIARLARKYPYIVANEIPKGVDVEKIDRRLMSRYEARISSKERLKRRGLGLGSLLYFRHATTLVMLLSEGEHKARESERFSDMREGAFYLLNHLVKVTGERVWVSMCERLYRDGKQLVKHHVRLIPEPNVALHQLEQFFIDGEVFPFQGVAFQQRKLLALLNRLRRSSGLLVLSCNPGFTRWRKANGVLPGQPKATRKVTSSP